MVASSSERVAVRAYHLAAFLALGFWQAAPLRLPGERFRLAVAGATGEWEDYEPASFDCEGNQTSPEHSAPVSAHSVGARTDAFFTGGSRRVSVVVGNSTSGGPTVGHGFFWGVEMAWEGRRFGGSVGYRDAGDDLLPRDPSSSASAANVSFSLRGGRLDAVHYRVEFRPLSETPSLAGEARVGLAFGQTGRGRTSGYLGVVLGSLRSEDDVRPAAFGEFGFPGFATVDLLVRAVYGPGHGTPNWGVGVGVRAVP